MALAVGDEFQSGDDVGYLPAAGRTFWYYYHRQNHAENR